MKTLSLPGGAKLDMVWIEPGTFTMGSPGSEPLRSPDEGPQHGVTISRGFYLGRYEVTQGQWESVMKTRPWSGHGEEAVEDLDCPAVYVSWDDAQEFAHRLNAAAGDSVYRLPTEAEWEYACRAGTGRRWSCGDDEARLREYAWYWMGNFGAARLREVGLKSPNPWGLYDVHGNVREWVYDRYSPDYYGHSPGVDPMGPESGADRVTRGGYWRDEARYVRSASRLHHAQDDGVALIGFRLLSTRQP